MYFCLKKLFLIFETLMFVKYQFCKFSLTCLKIMSWLTGELTNKCFH